MKKLNLRLLRLIKNSKGQFIAVTAVIIVGLLVYTALSMAAVNLESTVQYYYDLTNFADLYVQLVKIPANAVYDLKNKFGIEEVQGRIVADVPMKVSNKKEKVTIRLISIPNSEKNINSVYMINGEAIGNKSKDILLVEQFAKARNIKVGDTIKLQIAGRQYNLNVKGIVASPEFVYLMENEQSFLPQPDKFGVIFVSDEFARQSLGYKDSYNEIVIKAKSEEQIEKIKDRLEKELDKYGVKRIITQEEQLSNRMISEEIKQLKKSSSTVPVLFLGIASIILGIMVSRMVRNDRTTIGVLKALGFSNLQIISHYTKYSLTIGVIGAVIGTIIGTVLSGYMTQIYIQFFNIPMLKINFYYKYMLLAVLLSGIFCIIAGLWGGRKVLKIHPAESMRPEAPKTGKRVLLEKIKFIWNKITFSWKMVIRNIFRSKKRFIFITLGISLTFSMTLLTIHLQKASIALFNIHYGEFQQMDYNINFNKPMNKRVIKDIENIIKVEEIEGKIEYPFEIIHGWKSKVVNIIGVEKDTKFYNFINLQDKKINLPSKGIVISENLAKYLDVKVGEKVKIKSFIPHRDDVYLEVKDIIKQGLGINGYMDIDFMAHKLLDSEMITGIYLNSNDNVKEKFIDMKNVSTVQSLQDLIDIFKQFMKLSIYSIGIMLIFSGILGFAIVYNATIMSITERTLEFSSLRVMGFSRKEIFKIIVKENVIMTIIGIIIGMPIGGIMIRSIEEVYSNDLYTIQAPISVETYIFASLSTLLFVFLSQLSTLKKIYKLDFIEALKSRIS